MLHELKHDYNVLDWEGCGRNLHPVKHWLQITAGSGLSKNRCIELHGLGGQNLYLLFICCYRPTYCSLQSPLQWLLSCYGAS